MCAVHRYSMYDTTESINNAFAISSFQKTDQMQALGHFHGYPLHFFYSR